MKQYALRYCRLMLGIVAYSLGMCLSVQANIGLAPWDAFSMGLSNLTGVSFGNMVTVVGVAVIVLVVLMGEKIGVGSLLNTLLIGTLIGVINWLGLIPQVQNFFLGVLCLLLGQVVISLATYLYIGSGFGCGPRDTLMVALGKRFDRVPIGAIRGGMEGAVLLVGWLLGAKVGVGTVIAVFGIGFILQFTFRLLKFDVKAVRHESILDTLRVIRGKQAPAPPIHVPEEEPLPGCEAAVPSDT